MRLLRRILGRSYHHYKKSSATPAGRLSFAVVALLLLAMLVWAIVGIATFVVTPKIVHYTNLTDTAVICTIVSNEEPYLDEWIDYNLGIGFSHIYIYDNSDRNELGHGWLDQRRGGALANNVSVIHYPGQGKQPSAYRECAARVLGDGHRWVFNHDADEYLLLLRHDTVTEFLTEHDVHRMAVAINWQVHSWNDEWQYRPVPATKRFVTKQIWDPPKHSGESNVPINTHVKTISNADKIVLTVDHHPHYATLKPGCYAVGTDGEALAGVAPWQNTRYPSDVALLVHYRTKSWKEYIAKRTRGRPTMTGQRLRDSMNERIAEARLGKGLHDGSGVDVRVWERLKRDHPKYAFFDQIPDVVHSLVDRAATRRQTNTVSIGICCYAKDQEAYIDEWVDYHLALGFTTLHIYDGSEEFWMRQWGERRGTQQGISIVHFPRGNHTDDDSIKVNANSHCAERHGKEHHGLVFMDVHDFFVPKTDIIMGTAVDGHVPRALSNLGSRSGSVSTCAIPFERKLFGHNDKFVYEPLPVTKRFSLQVNQTVDTPAYVLLLKTDLKEVTANSLQTLKNDLIAATSTECIATSRNNTHVWEVSIHHYLRSRKECNKERTNNDLCNAKGDVEDSTAWEQLQHMLTWYSNFNGMIF
eukprot:CAMPEP_0183709654 /NCGR_PEP_ID=MMETSP0737-20130205/5657_1 /TAXON_ID=385413 /ORGANISM="Thalassiosira miniscula, Strain CCMP1093" /LENGTH=640 /DNA_ID=CAMNT_0025937811 /DNA_START=1 /DNA_END=1923 /DNA_ORIENTATION=-